MKEMFDNIYSNKTVFISGISGFKGSWLALWLSKLGAKVVGYSLDNLPAPSHFKLLNLNVKYIEGDIRDKELLNRSIEEVKPDIVFHLAAQALVRYSYQNPVETFETNVLGTLNLFEACRRVDSVKAIVNVTSDKCYKNSEWIWGYRENDPMGGYDPYSASKGCAELLTDSYINSFFNLDKYSIEHNILLASARAGNVIGGGDWAQDRLIPDIVRAVGNDEKVVIRSPHSIRPWQHVLEPLSGYLFLGQKLLEKDKRAAEGWNFGPDDNSTLSVEEVVKLVNKSWPEVKYEIKASDVLHEAKLLKLDCSKAHYYMGWKPAWSGEEAVKRTALWYKEFYCSPEKAVSSSYSDLELYIEDAAKSGARWVK